MHVGFWWESQNESKWEDNIKIDLRNVGFIWLRIGDSVGLL
jgi:hypothetical protein